MPGIVVRAEHAMTIAATLGEGPIWRARDSALWCVDIKKQRVHRFDPATRTLDAWNAPGQIGWIIPSTDGRFLTGLADGLYRFDPATGAFVLYRAVETHLPGNRLNDAAVDCAGRVWFGSMDNSEKDLSGRLYSLRNGAITDSGLDPVCITNGPAISPDGRTLYAVDTANASVDAFHLGADGALSGRKRFLMLDAATEGYADGVICDAAGGVWLGLFGGWAARRYAPDGALTDEVRFPVANVTKIALGGNDLRTAYATTAQVGLDETARARQPLAGDIFTFRVDTPGVASIEVALD